MHSGKNRWLDLDEDGATRDPDELDRILEYRLGETPRSIGQVLCLSLNEPAAMLDDLMKLEDYVARYLHQPMSELATMTRDELMARFAHTVDIIRGENGKPPVGEFDPDQEYL